MTLLRRMFWLIVVCPGLCFGAPATAARERSHPWADWFAQQSAQADHAPGQSVDGNAAAEEKDRRGSRRLSPEERRQLRHDVRNAGRDIYPEQTRRDRQRQRQQRRNQD